MFCVMNIVLLSAIIALRSSQAPAQDAPFEFRSPFGSDGTNQPNLDPVSRNYLVLDHIWDDYVSARKRIDQPLPHAQPGGYSKEEIHWLTVARFGQLLQTMAELRAFITQNEGYADETQKAEVARIDPILRSLRLRYYPRCGQDMCDFCGRVGINSIQKSLTSIFRNADGSARALPPFELGMRQVLINPR